LSTERERQKEETLGNLRRRMIEKLTSCYHAIFKARISIQANPSVETYDEVVQVIANQQLELVNMKGEAVVTPGLFSESEVIGQNVAKINGYLAELVEEYARSRQGIAQAQIPANLKLGLGNLHHLGDFKNAGNQFIEKVIQPYQTAFREMVKDVWSRRER
jgi:hypothetical protein